MAQVLLLKLPGLKAALGIPDITKIQAEQAAAAGGRPGAGGQTAAKAVPVIPATVFSSRAEALRSKDVKASVEAGSSGAPPAANPPPPGKGPAKGKIAKPSPPGRQMHTFSSLASSPGRQLHMFAAVPFSAHWRGMPRVGVSGGFGR